MTAAQQTVKTGTCKGLTSKGVRCRRRALPDSEFCTSHTAQAGQADPTPPAEKATGTDVPRDIDRGELNDVISDLRTGRRFGDGAGSPVNSVIDDLTSVLQFVTSNLGRVRDAAIANGIIDVTKVEGFVADVAHALSSASSAMTERFGGTYDEDDFGFDPGFTEALAPLVGLLYQYYWRVDVDGIGNVPGQGRALLVSNHAGGGLPFDGAMIRMAIYREQVEQRHARMTVLDWAMSMPWLADFMKKTGQVLANSANAVELLERDEIVGVFPEGIKGMSKPFSQRYNLERFGRGGFVRIALRTGAPIIPVAVVGSEEIYPKIGNLPFVNKLVGAPFVPITPLFPLFGLAGLIPLPSKWHIEFCEPIDVSMYPPEAADDRSFVLELSEQVRTTIQRRLRANLLKRDTPFW